MPQLSLAKRPSTFKHLCTALGPPARLSRALPASGIVIGLIVAAFGMFRPAAPPLTAVPPGYVALVNRKGVLLSDFISQTEAETGSEFSQTTPEERRRVLQEMVDQELLVQRGLVLDLPETAIEVREAMAAAVNAQVSAPLLAITPTDAQLQAFYDSHRANYTTSGTMTVHDLVLHVGGYQNADQSLPQAQIDAAEAVYQLRSGASIDYVMEHFGIADSGRVDNSEQLDFAAQLHLGPKLYAVAQTLGGGEVSDPVADTDGVHILVMDRRVLPTLANFSAARSQVYSDYRQAESQRARRQNLAILRAEARILLAPGESE